MIKGNKMQLMISEYGLNPSRRCGTCCNCHEHPELRGERICIAFGLISNYDCRWNVEAPACGIYNKPFLALRPRRNPLAETYESKKRIKEQKDTEQSTLF